MNPYIDKAKQLFKDSDDLNIETVLHLMYYLYGNRKETINEEMSCSYEAIKDSIKHLNFQRQDAILCAVNVLSSQYERTAFCDGLIVGASLILSLLDSEKLTGA